MVNVVMYTRPSCIFCLRAKWLLWRQGIAYETRDARDERTRAILLARTGRKTVPQVFIDGEAIGGFDELRLLLAPANCLSAKVQADEPRAR